MRILEWSALYAPEIGGIENQLLTVNPLLEAAGHEVTVIASYGGVCRDPYTVHRGIDVYRYPFREAVESQSPRRLLELTKDVAELKQRVQPDLVHVHASGPEPWIHLRTLGAWPCPTVVTVHNEADRHMLGTPSSLVRRLLESSQWTIAVSEHSRRELATLVPAISGRLSTVHNGVVAGSSPPEPLPETPRLGLIGRLADQKAPLVAIDAIALLLRSHPETQLIVVGDGHLRSAVERRVQELDIASSVTLVGAVAPDRVVDYIRGCVALLMPSLYEGLPLVAMEAALEGRPLAATRVGGLADVLDHEITGLVVPRDDAAALAAASARLLDDRELATRLGSASRARVERLAAPAVTVEKLEEIYRRVLMDGDVNDPNGSVPPTPR